MVSERQLVPSDRRRDEDSGKYDTKYQYEGVLKAVRRLEPTTTGEVANELDCHRNTAREKLNDLADRGELKKTEQSNTFIWQTI
ncbi:ArsR family transcriptional regulator [Natrinema thermotolerans]